MPPFITTEYFAYISFVDTVFFGYLFRCLIRCSYLANLIRVQLHSLDHHGVKINKGIKNFFY